MISHISQSGQERLFDRLLAIFSDLNEGRRQQDLCVRVVHVITWPWAACMKFLVYWSYRWELHKLIMIQLGFPNNIGWMHDGIYTSANGKIYTHITPDDYWVLNRPPQRWNLLRSILFKKNLEVMFQVMASGHSQPTPTGVCTLSQRHSRSSHCWWCAYPSSWCGTQTCPSPSPIRLLALETQKIWLDDDVGRD